MTDGDKAMTLYIYKSSVIHLQMKSCYVLACTSKAKGMWTSKMKSVRLVPWNCANLKDRSH